MAEHALLSPSAAHRWLHCTASPRLEQTEEDMGSSYAEEGTLAHAYCARALKQHLGLPTDGEDEEIRRLGHYHDTAMDEHVETYVAIVTERLEAARKRTPDARLLVEQRLDFSRWIPESFGTADAVIIADGTMEVIDFKYGRGVRVDAKDNPQMMIYALGGLWLYDFDYGIDTVRMTIIQPRLENFSEWEIPVASLLRWTEETLRPKAREAFDGKGRQVPGDWCRFCRVRRTCKELARMAIGTAESGSPMKLSKRDIETDVLPRLAAIKTWVSDMEEYALQQALDGVRYKGFKLVEGRSNRRITDLEAAAAMLREAGYAEEAIYKPREMRTLTDLERTVGKKKFGELCGGLIDKPPGKPTLVPESDRRPELNSPADDFEGMT